MSAQFFSSLMGASKSAPAVLPLALPTPTLDADDLPSLSELRHWSGRLTHSAIAAGVAVGIALVLHWVVFAFLRRMGQRKGEDAEIVAAAQLYHAARWAMVATALGIADNADKLLAKIWGPLERFAVPAITGWVLYAMVKTGAELMARRAGRNSDAMTARSRRTRITILSRSVGGVIIFLTVALILLGFPGVQHIGATLMASAGLIGIAVGAAAQPALKSLIAGVQVAITEPIRIGDFVVVEGERGRVEDIRLSYVVISTGDERRLIVPTVKFLDNTFQNWTRVEGISGAVVIPIRPCFDVEPLRKAFLAALAHDEAWDGRQGALVVSDVHVGSVELKLVVSAREPAQLNALLPRMREAMLDWLRLNEPGALCTET